MNPYQPLLILRARVKPELSGRFREWFVSTHLNDVRRIPGIASVEWGTTPDGTYLGLYCWEDPEAMQRGFTSPESAYARGTWDRWSRDLEEFDIEMFMPVVPPSVAVSIN